MAITTKHRKQSAKADGADTTLVRPQADWNDGHVFSGGANGNVLMRDTSDATYGADWAAQVYYDKTNVRLGLRESAPSFDWHWTGADGASVLASLDAYGTGVAPTLMGRRARGTKAAAAAVAADDVLLEIGGRGYGATGFAGAARAAVRLVAAEAWSDTAQGTYLSLLATAPGGTTLAELARLSTSALTLMHGQCRLTKSGVNLLLSPYNGNQLIIAGINRTIPDAGVTLGVGGLVASTTYYIYAYMAAGTMTLEAVATTHATQAGTGVEIKSGDATRTLVGLARTTAGIAWTNTTSQRFVRSWFNDPGFHGFNNFTLQRSVTGVTPTEIHAEIRVEFISWSGELILVDSSGRVVNDFVGGYTILTDVAFDGTSGEGGISASGITATNTTSGPVDAKSRRTDLTEGYHFATLIGYTDTAGKTGNWQSACRLWVAAGAR